ncbi:response regulator transcription factor [Clostridium sp. MSJ-4]|uniref:Response regulator transcription factor n=1 Tax=Clostridium simiarum TaxID=2841506 RepID=A0ABS6F161_9CLOT|nr:response regulator transcription factor [Clostridium simiarum]MBU5591323.1 response regulator transcription factor [Clostridium simiarum]
MGDKILVIEDDNDLGNLIKDYLEIDGFQVLIANDGLKGVNLANDPMIKLIILDIMLPLLDGVEVCKRIRRISKMPILMLSAKSGEMDKILALGVGADDYMTKPFSPMELVARVKAHIRRYTSFSSDIPSDVKQFGDLIVDSKAYKAILYNQEVPLTSKEFQILDFFTSNPSQVFSKSQIYESVWGYSEYMDENTIAVYVKRLREKLGEYGERSIKTIWGVGYKWEIAE